MGLDYDSPYRVGLAVFISMPSAASGPWSGIAGVRKLLGARAMKRLIAAERTRALETACKFLAPARGSDYLPEGRLERSPFATRPAL